MNRRDFFRFLPAASCAVATGAIASEEPSFVSATIKKGTVRVPLDQVMRIEGDTLVLGRPGGHSLHISLKPVPDQGWYTTGMYAGLVIGR